VIRFLILLNLILLFAASCQTIRPLPPEVQVLSAPVINSTLSFVNFPVEIDLSKQLRRVEHDLPNTFSGEEKQCEGVSFAYRFERDPIDFSFNGKDLYYEVDGKFELKLEFCPKCHMLWDQGSCAVPRVYASCGANGEPMRRVKVGYSTSVEIQPNYGLKSNTVLKKFDIIDPCKITVFRYDATAEVKKQVKQQLEKLEKDIDKQIERIDLRSSLNSVWSELQRPINLGTYGYLYLHPKSVAVDKPEFKHNAVHMDVTLTVAPVVNTSPQPIKESQLPALEPYKKRHGFDISVDIRAGYDSLSAIANQNLIGKVWEVKGKKVVVKHVAISGTNKDKMLIKLDFEGSKKGTIYLEALPFLDTASQVLSLHDVHFDIKTKSVLLKSAKWLFNDKILEEIQKNVIVDLKAFFSSAKKELTKQLNTPLSKEADLIGKVNELKLKQVFLAKDALMLRTQFSGDMKVKLR
jgi:hypothetical protein